MKKKWIAEGLVLLVSFTACNPLHGSESHSIPSGKAIVAEVEVAYKKGKYDSFLEQLDQQYKKAGKAGVLHSVFKKAKTSLKKQQSLTDSEDKLQKLTQERNQRLLTLIEKSPKAEIAERIDSIVYYALQPQQTAFFDELEALREKVPEANGSTVENKISALETEYYIKSLLLDIANLHSGTSFEELQAKKTALILEKLDRIEDVAKDFDDVTWRKKIQQAKPFFLAHRAYQIDSSHLKAMANGSISPQNSVEEKVQAIMMDYQQQQNAYLSENTKTR